jgi:guanylate kinase
MSRLVVVAGPSAVGKGTLVAALRAKRDDVWVSVSATTRQPRQGEQDGVHYYFVTEDEFSRMIDAGELLEWAVVHGTHRYGTPRKAVEERLALDMAVVLEIDLQGARQVKRSMPDALFVFVAPPTFEDLVDRLAIRGTEDDEERQRRLRTAREELAAVDEFDVTVINDRLDDAVAELEAIVASAR